MPEIGVFHLPDLQEVDKCCVHPTFPLLNWRVQVAGMASLVLRMALPMNVALQMMGPLTTGFHNGVFRCRARTSGSKTKLSLPSKGD